MISNVLSRFYSIFIGYITIIFITRNYSFSEYGEYLILLSYASILSVIGLLGLLGIPLDIMTITVAAISVGMAVDNTIHYIYRYKKEMKASNSSEIALASAHTTTGRAIFYTAATIAAGFSILDITFALCPAA